MEKKIYSSGFHVEWKNNISREQKTSTSKLKSFSNSKSKQQITRCTIENNSFLTKSNQQEISKKQKSEKHFWQYFSERKDSTKLQNRKSRIDNPQKIEISHFAKVAFGLDVLALLLFLLSGFEVLLFFGIAIEIFAIYFSILGFREIKANPDKYIGKRLIIWGFLLAPIAFVIIVSADLLFLFGVF